MLVGSAGLAAWSRFLPLVGMTKRTDTLIAQNDGKGSMFSVHYCYFCSKTPTCYVISQRSKRS